MWKANLNRHFTKLVPSLKISAFLIFWNLLFHSMTLAILLLWSLTSNRITFSGRMGTLNQFLSENQILFAALCSVSALLFFKDPLFKLIKRSRDFANDFNQASIRGLGLAALMILALTLKGSLSYLGLSTQLNLNFLASYAWIFRAVMILVFVFSTEFLVKGVLRDSLLDPRYRFPIETLTLISVYWIWFNPEGRELLSLFLLFSLTRTFWSSFGFLSGFFVMVHAVCGLNFFQNESAGLFQFKPEAFEESVLKNINLILTLFTLNILVQTFRYRTRKEELKT